MSTSEIDTNNFRYKYYNNSLYKTVYKLPTDYANIYRNIYYNLEGVFLKNSTNDTNISNLELYKYKPTKISNDISIIRRDNTNPQIFLDFINAQIKQLYGKDSIDNLYGKDSIDTRLDTPAYKCFSERFKRRSGKKEDEKSEHVVDTKDAIIELTYYIIQDKLTNIADLIKLGKQYDTIYKNMKNKFNINIKILSDLVEPLEKLDKMIAMDNIKHAIFNKIILYLQELDNKNKDFLHTVICGGPGMGKTDVAKIIGEIYSKLGFLSKGKFIEAKITDLKGSYIGQSEQKTQKFLDDAIGNVLFVDEAYSLGSDDKIDSYSQSIIDIINPFMDKNKEDFVLIIAGYKDELIRRFFKGNQGLRSRFGLWLDIDDYKPIDIRQIFIKKIHDYGWSLKEDEISVDFFIKHKKDFKYCGRDMENLFAKCKITHAKRVLYLQPEFKKCITIQDLENGYKIYKEEVDIDKKGDMSEYMCHTMYM